MNSVDTYPKSPKVNVNLVHPYFTGNGRDGSAFIMYHEPPELGVGMVMSTEHYQIISVIGSITTHDIFEDVVTTVCRFISSDPNEIIDINSRHLHYMFSAHSETKI